MRKSGSVTDKVCNYINSKPIGHQFTNKDVREEMDIPYNLLERECYVLIGLKVCGCVKRVKRGLWEVTARVPDFVDSTIFDGNHGYTKYEGTYPNGTWVPRGKKWKVGEPNPYTGEPTVTVEIPVTEYNVTNVIERVDSMMEVIDESNNATEDVECKFIYALNINNEHIRKIKVRKAVHARSNEYYSLHAAIAALANLTAGAIEQVADLMLEELEEDKLSVPATEHSIEVLNETKSNLEIEEDKLIEELDAIFIVVDETDGEVPFKVVYGYENGRFYKKHLKISAIIFSNESTNLKWLIQSTAGSQLPWTIMAEEEIEKIKIDIEANNTKKDMEVKLEDLTKKIKLEIIVNPHHITIEDIRGKEAYLYEDGLIGKGIIKSFQLKCGDGTSPMYHDIEVATKWSDGTTGTKWIDDAKLLITKEEAFKKLEDNLNSL